MTQKTDEHLSRVALTLYLYDTLTRVHPGKDHFDCAAHGTVPKSASDLVGFD